VGSILTGLYPNKHRAEDREDKLSTDVRMISEVLKSQGYSTIYITPNVNVDTNFNFIQGIDFYKFSIQKPHKWSHYRSSEYLNEDFSEIIENNPDLQDKPIFAFLHTVDPHDPYTPKPPFLKFKKNGAGRGKLAYPVNIGIKKAEGGLNREDIDFIKSLYDCEILHNDYYFGKWIEYLKEKKLYENAIIILVADHGEQFDEHDNFFHGQSIYNEEAHVPLIIKLPHDEFPGTQTDTFVSQVDLYPTILDYLGIEILSVVDGVSLFDILKRKNLKRPVFIKEEMDGYNFLGMISQDNIKHIITYKDESFIKEINIEQYNLVKDFGETTDMFERKNPFHARFIKFSADYFLTEMEKQAFKEEKEVDLNKLDPEKIEQLKALGYLK
jgi:arylsulfatase A-like enzyme